MVNIHANGNRVAYGIKHFDLDTADDLTKLNKAVLTPGSTAFIIENSKYYMLNGQRKWIEINPYGMGGSSSGGSGDSGGNGSGDDSDSENDNIYDGGSIDGSDPA